MPLNNPDSLFKENSEAFDGFLRALSTIYSTGVLEMLRERGRVRLALDSSPNYTEVQSVRAAWSAGYNQALDELVYFRELFMSTADSGKGASMDFGSMEKTLQNGDLEPSEIEALQHGQPIPELKREPIPESVVIVKPTSI